MILMIGTPNKDPQLLETLNPTNPYNPERTSLCSLLPSVVTKVPTWLMTPMMNQCPPGPKLSASQKLDIPLGLRVLIQCLSYQHALLCSARRHTYLKITYTIPEGHLRDPSHVLTQHHPREALSYTRLLLVRLRSLHGLIHSRKLTWKPKKGPMKTTVLLKGYYMGFHVSFGGV